MLQPASVVEFRNSRQSCMIRRVLRSLNTDVFRLWRAASRLRAQGHGIVVTLLYYLPLAVAARIYRRLTGPVNGTLLNPLANHRRFRRFVAGRPQGTAPHFYLIVMPGTLHFLLPCLNLLPHNISIELVHNGTRRWERRLLQECRPDLRAFTLRTLPRSSLAHGDVLNLFLHQERRPFGIIDYDLYLFGRTIFDQLWFAPGEFALGLFMQHSQTTDLSFPHTCFLYLNTPIFRNLMQRYKVDARVYRRPPSRVIPQLERIGLGGNRYLKHWLRFFDTLNLLFALALAEGLRIRQIVLHDPRGAYHIAQTSLIGSPRTIDPGKRYIHLRFLEHAADPVIRARYAPMFGEPGTSGELRRGIPPASEALYSFRTLDALMERLSSSRR